MTDSDLQLKIMDALVHMYAAIKNVQLYSADSPVITNSIERLYLYLLDILRQESPLVFAESEKQALLCGKLLKQQDQETIHVSYLLDSLLNFGLQSISFEKGLQKEELHIFINLFAKKPEHVRYEGGLPKLMRENKITHIYTDKKIYVIPNQDQKITGSDIIKDKSFESNVLNVALSEEEGQISESIAEMMKALRHLDEMEGNIESFFSEEQKDVIKTLLGQAVEWIETETTVTPAYKKIIESLQKLVQGFINHGLFAEANCIIAVFSKINNGSLKKDDKVREVSLEVLKNLASENNINFLFKEININEKNKTTDAFQIFSAFGDDLIIKKLLDIVRNAKDSKERIRIIHMIQEMGQKAIPNISESMTPDAPWYFLRNMAYILGRIGNETSADILRPLLLNKDKRVRMEALKSIIQIGGNKKGALLLSVMSQADQEFRVNIIEMLGKIRCTEAVPELLDMLKSKSSMDKGNQISLQENICNALGAICSPDAIPTLSEIAESKSFLGIGSYPIEVKYAAKRALTSIKRKP
jgi:HEAT repeat protein